MQALPHLPSNDSIASGAIDSVRGWRLPRHGYERVFGLTRSEQLLLWSARRWRHGRHRWDQVEQEFRLALGPDWADGLLAWDLALDLLHLYPASSPQIRNGCATDLSDDEQALLALVAALQAGNPVDASLLLARLAPQALRTDLRAALELVAEALRRLPLPVRAPVPPMDGATIIPLRAAASH
ncbi:hypothetical protein [Oleisolibacter albus]|uniref:hypothetical protein n=1 Tax=Oleisolibacter albus TaxID=2171757 RepID=UPI000DF17695|nr:hypothetical protein [Oleisolibacter albus]